MHYREMSFSLNVYRFSPRSGFWGVGKKHENFAKKRFFHRDAILVSEIIWILEYQCIDTFPLFTNCLSVTSSLGGLWEMVSGFRHHVTCRWLGTIPLSRIRLAHVYDFTESVCHLLALASVVCCWTLSSDVARCGSGFFFLCDHSAD